jgi:hypothetical protein
MLAILLNDVLLIEGFRVEPAKIRALNLPCRVLRVWIIFKLQGIVLIILKLLLAVHTHVGLALLPGSIQAPFIQ